jgi:16S rRNA (cytosine967-C5)-methyltransferase
VKKARETALDLLIQVESQQAYSNLMLQQVLSESRYSDPDRRLITELVYGVIQRANTLDYLLDRLVKKGSRSLQLWVHQLLRLGLYQLIYLDRVPAFAAIDEAVKIARKRGNRGIAGLVNGVLRNFLRRKEELWPHRGNSLQEKAVLYSHPAWMIERYEKQWGVETAKALFFSLLERPVTSLRINRLRLTREEWMKKWSEEGRGEAELSPLSPVGVRLHRAGNPAQHPHFDQGLYTVQDESAMLVAQALAPSAGSHVLDLCAAPGGKTTHLAELMDNQGQIVACDIHPHKMKLITDHAQRLGISIIRIMAQDGRQLPQQLPTASFDAILLDAPCSGLGVMRRRPEIKWRRHRKDFAELQQLQQQLLTAAYTLLKPGGQLLYSTCTFEQSENQDQIISFLEHHPDMHLDKEWVTRLPHEVREKAIIGDGWMQILPQHFHSDGFFLARLVKQS